VCVPACNIHMIDIYMTYTKSKHAQAVTLRTQVLHLYMYTDTHTYNVCVCVCVCVILRAYMFYASRIFESYIHIQAHHIHIQAHHENYDAACMANSGTKTEDIKQELHDKRHPERTHTIENTLHRQKELHGEHHPPVAIKFGAEPLVASGQGRMELRFHVVGALIGFKYRIVLQEADILVHRVIQQREICFSPTDDSASNEITAELVMTDSTKTDSTRFAIGVWDAHAGLREDEALVARKDATFPRPKSEHHHYVTVPPTACKVEGTMNGPVVDAKHTQCGDEHMSTRVFLKAGRAHVAPEVHMSIHTNIMCVCVCVFIYMYYI